jgi:hypothetical protein
MSPEVGTVESVATPVVTEKAPEVKSAKKVAAKKVAPKAKPESKKAPAKPAKKAAPKEEKPVNGKSKKTPAEKVEKTAERPDRSAADAPVTDRRIAVVKALRKMNATKATVAVSIGDLAAKLGYTHHDVYCLVFHQYPLVVEGFVALATTEEKRGLQAYLTAKGLKTDFSVYPFVKKPAAKE